MTEAVTLAEIRLAVGREPDTRLFRNQTGALRDHTGRLVRFGLHKGSSDLIGWRTVTIGPEHLNTRLAVFAAIEVKAPNGRHPVTPEQATFLHAVRNAGGFAGVATNAAQARKLLGLAP